MTQPIDLAAWRLHHAKLTQRDAADRAGLTQRHASQIESQPARATVGALRAYVEACGGRLELVVEHAGVRRLLVLVTTLLVIGCTAGERPDPAPDWAAEAPAADLRVWSHDGVLRDLAAQAGERIRRASGLAIEVTAAPTDVELWWTADELPWEAYYSPGARMIAIATHALPELRAPIMTHELVHAFGVGHTCEACPQLMSEHGLGNPITAADLEALCAAQPCRVFVPEVD